SALFNVLGTAAGARTTLNGTANSDLFQVGSSALTLDDIKGTLVLNGGSQGTLGTDTVNLFDQGSVVGNSYTLRVNSVTRTGAGVISYSDVEQLTLNAGSGADSAGVLGTADSMLVTLNMGNGNDVVNLGTRTGTSLDGFRRTITVNGEGGNDSIILNDQVDDSANTYVITATDVIRNPLFNLLSYATTESLTI